MINSDPVHKQQYCYLIELTGDEQGDLLAVLTPVERALGEWERVHSAKLPTWRLWTNENADTIRYTVRHIIARNALPQNDYWLIQYQGNDHGHPRMLHPQFHTR
ncbi:hypothetical protein [Lactiplantibacillus modestisalitolerans]|uniref:Uncharacterized protein n=1 Tax=Lactiplantibacillus modestisalitolerans TaxID=1457219 RepID=A0ABV5WVB8_9LACO|nr:hypothetical protein [Lactiplantibacillus modestisalitolerans]